MPWPLTYRYSSGPYAPICDFLSHDLDVGGLRWKFVQHCPTFSCQHFSGVTLTEPREKAVYNRNIRNMKDSLAAWSTESYMLDHHAFTECVDGKF